MVISEHVTQAEPVHERPVYGFMHVATHGPWRKVVAELLDDLRESGLYDRTARLFVSILGPGADSFTPDDGKLEVVHRSANLKEYEFPTLRNLREFCGRGERSFVYYIHTKGVFNDTPAIRDWRAYMRRFVIGRHLACVAKLQTYDACGVNLSWTPWPHFSGNFWWARSEYAAALPPVDAVSTMVRWPENRHRCEQWIGSGAGARLGCLHRSLIDHYHVPYAARQYSDTVPPATGAVTDGIPVGDPPVLLMWPPSDGGARRFPAAARPPFPPRVAVVFDKETRPDTTGVYCVNALRRLLPSVTHVPPSELHRLKAGDFDLFLFVDDGLDYDLPAELRPSALWAIDTHLNPNRLLRRAANVEYVFAAQRDGVALLRRHGVNCVGWLPLACDPDVHRKHLGVKTLDVCFVGHLNTPARREMAGLVTTRFPSHFVGQKFFEEMAQTYSASRVILNLSVGNDLNMRVFEALASGSLLLTDVLDGNGLTDLFTPGEHLETYDNLEDLPRCLERYLGDNATRERIAAAGRAHVLSHHTYVHRMCALLAAVADRRPDGGAGWSSAPGDQPTFHTTFETGLTSLIIPVFNGVTFTHRCLEAVRRLTGPRHEVLVVDDGSTDETAKYLSGRGDVRGIRSPVNRGFPAAVNLGIAASRGDRIVLLNNDTVVTDGWLDRMLRVLDADPSAGLVGPHSNGVPGDQRLAAGYDSLDQLPPFAEAHARQFAGQTARAQLLGGFCLMFRREVVERVGRFDEAFGIGTYDDYEFCRRAASGGYGLVIARDAYVHHDGAATLHACGVDITQLLRRNEALFLSRRATGMRPAGAPPRSPKAGPLTSIVVVTFNGLAYTKMCLEAVRRCTPESHEVLVVDNGSTDGTTEYLGACPEVRLIANEENRGFPAAANQGIRSSDGGEVVLLNNDVVVTPGWLARLRAAMRSAKDIGMVGPCSNAVSGPQQVPVDYADVRGADGFASAQAARFGGLLEDADRLVGFCLMLRRELIDRVGLLDERFGIGNFEDDDYCRRALACGFRAVIARGCFVHHFGSASFRANGIDHAGLMERNGRLFKEKWSTPGTLLAPPAAGAGGGPGPHNRANGRPRLSLCMIVRDSSRTLDACLQSIRPWVDEMIVVDTGSVDGTRAIAERAGARVRDFPWCDDFAAARNESLNDARGEWLFWMDADDTIDDRNGRLLRDLVSRDHPPGTLGFVLQVHCPAGPDAGPYATSTAVDHVKVFRNLPELRFTGRIHEQILPAIRRCGGDVDWTEIFVVHSGSDVSADGRARKQARDLRLLELELAEDPDSTFTLFNIGMTLLDAARYADALPVLCRALQLASEGESHVRKLYAFLAQSYSGLGRHGTALKTCVQGLAVFPDDPELLFRRGVLEQTLGALGDAERTFRTVVALRPHRVFQSVDSGILGVKAWHNLATILQEQRRWEPAATAWQRVLEYDGSNWVAWRGLLDAWKATGNLVAVERLADAPGGVPPDVAAVARARVSVSGMDPQAAIDELERAWHASGSAELLRELCELAFGHEALETAERGLSEMARRDPQDPAACQNLAVVHLRRRNYEEAERWAKRSLQLRPDHVPAEELLNEVRRNRLTGTSPGNESLITLFPSAPRPSATAAPSDGGRSTSESDRLAAAPDSVLEGGNWVGQPLRMRRADGGMVEVEGVRGYLLAGDMHLLADRTTALRAGAVLVEVGSWMGLSATVMASALLAGGNATARITCVDTWAGSAEHQDLAVVRDGRLYDSFEANIRRAGVSSLVRPMRSTSDEAAASFEDASVDLLFLDADHSAAECLRDLDAWWRKLRPGGTVLVHDCVPGGPVESAVREFVARYGLTRQLYGPPCHYVSEIQRPMAADAVS